MNTETPVKPLTAIIGQFEAVPCPTCTGAGGFRGAVHSHVECDRCDGVGYVQSVTGQWLDSIAAARIIAARKVEQESAEAARLKAARARAQGTPDRWELRRAGPGGARLRCD